MFISRAMSLGARVFVLLVPLVTALDPAAAHTAESRDFAELVDIGGGRNMYLKCRGVGSPTMAPLTARLDNSSARARRFIRSSQGWFVGGEAMPCRGPWLLPT
jgi:hypothetical protein